MRVLVTAAAVVAALASTAVAGSSRPLLRVVDADPLVARASGFEALERVTVSATTRRGVIVRRVRTGSRGGFTVRFPTAFDFCAGITRLRAVGVRSGAVTIRPTPRPCVDLQE
jgi:hypothetical protein